MDKILRIDMGAAGGPKATTEAIGSLCRAGRPGDDIGHRLQGGPALCHPLGAENKLVIAPGLLSGTAAAMSGRLSVGCKSPLTGGIKEANAGGQAAQVLARLGYAAIILEGKPDGRRPLQDPHQQGRGQDHGGQQPEDARQLRPGREDEGRIRRQGRLHLHRPGRRDEAGRRLHRLHRHGTAARPATPAAAAWARSWAPRASRPSSSTTPGMPMRAPKDPDKFQDANKTLRRGAAASTRSPARASRPTAPTC